MAEKYKLYEIHKRMCDEHEEASLNQNIVYKWAKYGFATTSLSEKDNINKNTLSLW